MVRVKLVGAIVFAALAGVAAHRDPVAAHAQPPDDRPFILKQLGPRAWAAINNPKAKVQAGANAGFIIGDDGVIVVDTASAEAAAVMLAEIRKLTPLPVKFVVNTHYHLDHSAGNRVYQDAGAVLLAHRNVRGWIVPENLKLFGKDIPPAMKALVEGIAPPAAGYEQAIDLSLGARVVQVRAFPGHTGGDSIVVVPDARVVFTGDLFWRQASPNTVDASTRPWVETLDAITKAYAGYAFMPGHGDVGTVEDVAAFRDYLATLRRLVGDAQAAGTSAEAMKGVVLPKLAEQYGKWDYFSYLAERNIAEMDAELKGTKRVPIAPAELDKK